MAFSISAGQLLGASQLASPNFNERPKVDIDLLVVHNISLPAGCFGTGHPQQLFTNKLDCSAHESYQSLQGLHVSAHLMILRTGEVLQFVNFDHRAWHAGQSEFQGRSNCNDFSIGIELEGADNVAYSGKQYRALVAVTQCLMQHYTGIIKERIVGHLDIAPNRKTDPGIAFDWDWYKTQL